VADGTHIGLASSSARGSCAAILKSSNVGAYYSILSQTVKHTGTTCYETLGCSYASGKESVLPPSFNIDPILPSPPPSPSPLPPPSPSPLPPPSPGGKPGAELLAIPMPFEGEQQSALSVQSPRVGTRSRVLLATIAGVLGGRDGASAAEQSAWPQISLAVLQRAFPLYDFEALRLGPVPPRADAHELTGAAPGPAAGPPPVNRVRSSIAASATFLTPWMCLCRRRR
jgi:hypothetical protein